MSNPNDPKTSPVSRRVFLGGALAAGAAFTQACTGADIGLTRKRAAPVYVPRHVLGGKGFTAPSERLNIACIGVGGKGAGDVDNVNSEYLVAFADPDHTEYTEDQWGGAPIFTFKKYPDVARYLDYRVMLDELGDKIDAVTISTPDHHHAPAAIRAMLMGKHVFVQKPMAHTIEEARLMAETAWHMDVQTVMGNQGHAKEGTRLICEWIWGGLIGEVTEVVYWTNRPIWPQGMSRPQVPPSDLPERFDWDVWLGPAPKRPYHDKWPTGTEHSGPVYHPFAWRGWWDFGTGALGDMGCHFMDAAYWALDLGAPTVVSAESSPVTDEAAPVHSKVVYEFPAHNGRGPVRVTWFDGIFSGGEKPQRPPELEEGRSFADERNENGQLFIGTEGKIIAGTYGEGPRIIPEAKMRELNPRRNVPEMLHRPPESSHYREWIMACKGQRPAGSNFAYAGPFTETVLLGNLAVRTGQRLEWDAAAMRVTNVPEANQYVGKEYRAGWGIHEGMPAEMKAEPDGHDPLRFHRPPGRAGRRGGSPFEAPADTP